MEMLIQFVLLAVGFAMLVKGADWFVDGASGVADKMGIPQLVIGLTIVAMGTSAPEAAVSITAALRNNAGITIGNVVGSNILNILIILGITAIIVSVPVAKSTIKFDIPLMIAATLLLMIFGYTGCEISFAEGIALWVVFVGYLVYMFVMAKKNRQSTDSLDDEQNIPLHKLIAATIIGLVLIVWGSDVTVDAATDIAARMGMSERFIGLTIVALGTSLPELFTSVSAAVKGKADIAIGNIVGSNIFNILFIVGSTALITPVVFEVRFLIDTAIAAAAGILLLLCVIKEHSLRRPAGILMLVCYTGYFVYLLMQ